MYHLNVNIINKLEEVDEQLNVSKQQPPVGVDEQLDVSPQQHYQQQQH